MLIFRSAPQAGQFRGPAPGFGGWALFPRMKVQYSVNTRGRRGLPLTRVPSSRTVVSIMEAHIRRGIAEKYLSCWILARTIWLSWTFLSWLTNFWRRYSWIQ